METGAKRLSDNEYNLLFSMVLRERLVFISSMPLLNQKIC